MIQVTGDSKRIAIKYGELWAHLPGADIEQIQTVTGLRGWHAKMPVPVQAALDQAGFDTTPGAFLITDHPDNLELVFHDIHETARGYPSMDDR